ncbi:MAG: hypothetical protein ABJN69_16330 [Hellea sp.]
MKHQRPSPKIPFDVGAAITQPFNLPGGKNFLIRLVLWATALLLLVYFAFGRQFIGAYIELFQNLATLDTSGEMEDPEAVMALMEPMRSIMGTAMLLWIFSWGVMVATETAMHKNIFRGTDHGIFPLRFGVAELRVALAQLVVSFISYGVMMIGYIVLIIFAVIASVGVQNGGAVIGVIGGILAFIAFIAMIGASLLAVIKLSPAAALSVRDDDVRVLEGWKATYKRFWLMFGSFLIVGIGGYIVLIIIMVIASIAVFAGMADISGLQDLSDEQAFAAFVDAMKKPGVMIPLIISLMVYVAAMILWYLCFWGIPNYAAQLDAQEQGSPKDF